MKIFDGVATQVFSWPRLAYVSVCINGGVLHCPWHFSSGEYPMEAERVAVGWKRPMYRWWGWGPLEFRIYSEGKLSQER